MNGLEGTPQMRVPAPDAGAEIRHTVCDICNTGCCVAAYVKDDKLLKVAGAKHLSLGNGHLCAKGHANREYIYSPERITTPLRRVGSVEEGSFEEISWEEALSEVARGLLGIRERFGPHSVAFYTGYSKWYRPFLQRLAYSFGSINYGSESSVRYQAGVMAEQLNAGCMSAPDLENAGVLMMWGCNQYYEGNVVHPPALRQKRRGMKIIVVDPNATITAQQLADVHLRPLPGTEGALAHGFARAFIRDGWIDEEYIQAHVKGFEEYKAYVDRFTLPEVSRITGLTEQEINRAIRIIKSSGPMALMPNKPSLVNYRNGLQNYRAVCALAAITGNYDRKGGCIPNGQREFDPFQPQGLDTRGFAESVRPKTDLPLIGAGRFPLWSRMNQEFQAMDLARQILEGEPYPVRALCAVGMNINTFPDNQTLKRALGSLDFMVASDLFLTEGVRYANIILPSCTSFERSEVRKVKNGLYLTRPVIRPLGQSRSDLDIICDLARSMELDDPLLCAGPEACYNEMMRDLPFGLDALKQSDMPVPTPRRRKAVPGEYSEGGLLTPSGKYELWSTTLEELALPGVSPLPEYLPPVEEDESGEYPFQLSISGRLPYVIHSRMHRVGWIRALHPDSVAVLHPKDAARLGIRQNDDVELRTPNGVVRLKANLSMTVLPGVVGAYQDSEEADVTAIIGADCCDPCSGFPGFRSVRCSVRKG